MGRMPLGKEAVPPQAKGDQLEPFFHRGHARIRLGLRGLRNAFWECLAPVWWEFTVMWPLHCDSIPVHLGPPPRPFPRPRPRPPSAGIPGPRPGHRPGYRPGPSRGLEEEALHDTGWWQAPPPPPPPQATRAQLRTLANTTVGESIQDSLPQPPTSTEQPTGPFRPTASIGRFSV